jgi:phage shock protein PspC (stress-responsive transcriptional regulator)
MNEVTKIHLGRQAYGISADAHRELRNYLDAIKKHVLEDDVVGEVELRMAELLEEHGVKTDQVILPADVAFLKGQLGNPQDFADPDQIFEELPDKQTEAKRLFRDTDNAMLAGVAAGLSKYFGVDVLLIRLIFVIFTFMGGWGILLYIVLWLLVPEAKTTSDRLQMAGVAVTVDSLKGVVKRADVKGAARRANNSLAGPINNLFRIITKVVGIGFMFVGLSMLLGITISISYFLLHSGSLVQDNIFPIGFKEHLLLYVACAIIGIIALFIVLFGVAFFRRKWPIHTWVTGALIGLIFIGLATGGGLAADVAPQIRNSYNATTHTVTRSMPAFTTVNLDQTYNANIEYQQSNTYSVTIQYHGTFDLSSLKTTVTHGTLTIYNTQMSEQHNCQSQMFCIPLGNDLQITINAPTQPQMVDQNNFAPSMPATPEEPMMLQQ